MEFTIWQIGTDDAVTGCTAVNVTDPDAWADVIDTLGEAHRNQNDLPEGLCLVDPAGVKVTTGDEGTVTEGLNLGLYYVKETDASGAYKMEGGAQADVEVALKADPFYVTIPYPKKDPSGGEEWIYNVNVYPKNQISKTPEKTIATDEEQLGKGLVIGSKVKYTITEIVPPAPNGSFQEVVIWDNLPNDGSLKIVGGLAVTLAGDPLDASHYVPTVTDRKMKWEPNFFGLSKLKDNQGKELVIEFEAEVLKVPEGGLIENPGTTLTVGENSFTVKNPQKGGPNLPLTGGAGTILLILGGVALPVFASTSAVVGHRRRAKEA